MFTWERGKQPVDTREIWVEQQIHDCNHTCSEVVIKVSDSSNFGSVIL